MEVLHRDEPRAAVLAERLDPADVLVRHLAREVRLVAEHRHEVLILREVRKDALDHEDVAAGRSGRARQEDLRHPTRRELRDELVAAKIPSIAGDQRPRRSRHGVNYALAIPTI